MLWLVVFLVASVVMQARQNSAIATAGRYRKLREERVALEAERAALERQIHIATSRRVLGDKAEKELGLIQPSDSQFTVFPLNLTRH